MITIFDFLSQRLQISNLKVFFSHHVTYTLLGLSGVFCHCSDTTPRIHITDIQPAPGCQGQYLTIKGWGFSGKVSDNIAKLDNRVLEVVTASPEELTVQLPNDATSGQVSVQVGNDIATGPILTIEAISYFIRFKADGQPKVFEVCGPRYGGNISAFCGSGYVSDINEKLAVISACNNEKMTLDFMKAWAGSTMAFESVSPSAHFEYYDSAEQKMMSSSNASTQESSELNVT
jgi:hypothetical protein